MNFIEDYKYIDGYNNKYCITNTGRVFVTEYRGNKVWREMKARIIRNYLAVGLRVFKDGKSIQTIHKIHRLVAEYFIPNPENKPCVNHKDGNKLNNDVTNLEWVTISENTKHSYRNKLQKDWWTKELCIVAINLIENYNYNCSDVAKLFRIPLKNGKGSVFNMYHRGYKTFNLTTKNVFIPKHSTPKPISETYKNYIFELLKDNTVLN